MIIPIGEFLTILKNVPVAFDSYILIHDDNTYRGISFNLKKFTRSFRFLYFDLRW